MRRLFFILLSGIFLMTGFPQEPKEGKLVNQVFEDFSVGKNKNIDTIVILLHPIHDIPRTDFNFERIKDHYKGFKKSTYENFVDNLDKEIVLHDLKTLDTPFIIDQAVYKDYSEIFSKHANIQIIEISNIGYSEDKTQAFIYFGKIQGAMSAGGVYLVYEKKKAKWRKKKIVGAWAT